MFCKQCGTQLPDGTGFCTACGAPQGAPQAAPQNAPVNPMPYPQPNMMPNIPVNTQPSPIGIYFKKVLKQITSFLKAPSHTLVSAYNEKTPVWATLAAALVLFGWFGMMAMVQGVGVWMGSGLGAMTESANFGMVLLFSMIIFAGGFAIKAGITWIASTQMAKLNVPFTSVLSVLALTELPLIAALFLASFTCFIWYPLALAFLLLGGIATATLYNEAIRSTGIFGEKAPILSLIVNCIYGLIITLLVFWALCAWSDETGIAIALVIKLIPSPLSRLF